MADKGSVLSVAEFSALPQPRGGIRQELRHGEVFELPPVKLLHTRIQNRLVGLLTNALHATDLCVDKEFPFRPLPERECWIAGVTVYHAPTE